jgi:hypothetical protein
MQEPYGKGLATRPDPESCADHGNMTGEALTRAHVFARPSATHAHMPKRKVVASSKGNGTRP